MINDCLYTSFFIIPSHVWKVAILISAEESPYRHATPSMLHSWGFALRLQAFSKYAWNEPVALVFKSGIMHLCPSNISLLSITTLPIIICHTALKSFFLSFVSEERSVCCLIAIQPCALASLDHRDTHAPLSVFIYICGNAASCLEPILLTESFQQPIFSQRFSGFTLT